MVVIVGVAGLVLMASGTGTHHSSVIMASAFITTIVTVASVASVASTEHGTERTLAGFVTPLHTLHANIRPFRPFVSIGIRARSDGVTLTTFALAGVVILILILLFLPSPLALLSFLAFIFLFICVGALAVVVELVNEERVVFAHGRKLALERDGREDAVAVEVDHNQIALA
jgi:hypothetical protein